MGPARGPIADFLAGPAVSDYAKWSPLEPMGGASDAYTLERLDDALAQLENWGVPPPSVEDLPDPAMWDVLDYRVRRAWTCLAILADRGCPRLFPVPDSEAEQLKLDIARRWPRGWGRRTDHLIRDGGFVEKDLAWLAQPDRLLKRAHRVRLREQLERFGVIHRRDAPGQPTWLLGGRRLELEAARFMRVVDRKDIHQVGRLIHQCLPGRRERKPGGEPWDRILGISGAGVYVVGAKPTPAIRDFLKDTLQPALWSLTFASTHLAPDQRFGKWVRGAAPRLSKGGYPEGPVLIVKLL